MTNYDIQVFTELCLTHACVSAGGGGRVQKKKCVSKGAWWFRGVCGYSFYGSRVGLLVVLVLSRFPGKPAVCTWAYISIRLHVYPLPRTCCAPLELLAVRSTSTILHACVAMTRPTAGAVGGRTTRRLAVRSVPAKSKANDLHLRQQQQNMKEEIPSSPPLSPTRRVMEGVRSISIRALGRDPHASPPKIGDWGRPGHLAPEEVKVYVSFSWVSILTELLFSLRLYMDLL